jgi:hypothetical protein
MKQSNQPKGDTGLLLEPVFHGSIDLLNWMLCRFFWIFSMFSMAENHGSKSSESPRKNGTATILVGQKYRFSV